ncbi:hypothetical protein GQ600_7775 [Phytophthora cactorum]|nr:hypothetical protein GQ600_7775 [Phytophthora cactorum]
MTSVDAALSLEVPLRPKPSETLLLTRGERWIPAGFNGPGERLYRWITNFSDRTMCLPGHAQLGVWLTGDRVPRHQGLVAVGSRQYAE